MSILLTRADDARFERHATQRSEEALDSLGLESGPVPLLPLVDVCGVRRVIFRSLPVSGGLSVDRAGFSIHVKASKKDARQWTRMFNSASDGGRGLPRRVRFTIAHEIAHTFFFDWRNGEPVSLVDYEERSQLRRLERACNRGAAALLVPEVLLGRLIAGRPWTPSLLRSAAVAFNVSLETLLWRLHELRGIVPPHSMGAVVRDGGTHLSILALATGTKLRERLSASARSQLLQLLRVSQSRFAAAESSWTVSLDDRVGVRVAAVRDCELRLECLYEQPRTGLLIARMSSNSQLVFPFR